MTAFDVDNRYGANAITRLYGDVGGVSVPMQGVRVPGEDMLAFRRVAAWRLALHHPFLPYVPVTPCIRLLLSCPSEVLKLSC